MEQIEELLKEVSDLALAEEIRQAFSELETISFTDSLTGLSNRRCFDQELPKSIAKAKQHNTPLSVIFMDLDDFKGINDRLGHPVGDQILREVSKLMRKQLRDQDLLARFGGEEFIALLPNFDEQKAALVAERLRRAIAEASFLGEKTTISCGVATFPKHATDAETLILLADRAMYTAKAASKNKVVIAGDFPTKAQKKVILGYRYGDKEPVSLWIENQFYPIHKWRQIRDNPACYLVHSERELILVEKRGKSWFLLE